MDDVDRLIGAPPAHSHPGNLNFQSSPPTPAPVGPAPLEPTVSLSDRRRIVAFSLEVDPYNDPVTRPVILSSSLPSEDADKRAESTASPSCDSILCVKGSGRGSGLRGQMNATSSPPHGNVDITVGGRDRS